MECGGHDGEPDSSYLPLSRVRYDSPNSGRSCTGGRDNSDTQSWRTGTTSENVSTLFAHVKPRKTVRIQLYTLSSIGFFLNSGTDAHTASATDPYLRWRRRLLRSRLLVQGREQWRRRRHDRPWRADQALDFHRDQGTERVGHQFWRAVGAHPKS